MPANSWLRKRVFVDFRVQGALIARVVLYWLTCLCAMTLLLVAWGMVAKPGMPLSLRLREIWEAYGSAAVVSLFLLPMVVFDLIRVSNRFAGPMFRLRRSMHDLAEGRKVAPIHFRPGDFWQDFARDFNTVAERAEEPKT